MIKIEEKALDILEDQLFIEVDEKACLIGYLDGKRTCAAFDALQYEVRYLVDEFNKIVHQLHAEAGHCLANNRNGRRCTKKATRGCFCTVHDSGPFFE